VPRLRPSPPAGPRRPGCAGPFSSGGCRASRASRPPVRCGSDRAASPRGGRRARRQQAQSRRTPGEARGRRARFRIGARRRPAREGSAGPPDQPRPPDGLIRVRAAGVRGRGTPRPPRRRPRGCRHRAPSVGVPGRRPRRSSAGRGSSTPRRQLRSAPATGGAGPRTRRSSDNAAQLGQRGAGPRTRRGAAASRRSLDDARKLRACCRQRRSENPAHLRERGAAHHGGPAAMDTNWSTAPRA
jgi:hypothetical protein